MRTMSRIPRIIASLLLGAGLAAGCGGDSDSDGDVSTGIAPNKLLSDVTPDEAAQACENLQAGFQARLSQDVLVRSICTIFGAASADTKDACIQARDECIQASNDPGASGGDVPDVDAIQFECQDGAVLTECTSTVGELETCFNDLLDQISSALNDITCDDAASLQAEDIDTFRESTFQPPASCEAVDCGENSPFGPGEEE